MDGVVLPSPMTCEHMPHHDGSLCISLNIPLRPVLCPPPRSTTRYYMYDTPHLTWKWQLERLYHWVVFCDG